MSISGRVKGYGGPSVSDVGQMSEHEGATECLALDVRPGSQWSDFSKVCVCFPWLCVRDSG